MNLFSKMISLFQGGEWRVLYRKNKDEEFAILNGDKEYWYADPFLLDYRGNTYLFTEAFNRRTQVGEIAVSVLNDGTFSEPKSIICNDYHMSYPDVFIYKDAIYMLPETGEGKRLELYEAIQFPYEWRRVVLKEHVIFADSTVYVSDGQIYVLLYDDMDNVTDFCILNVEDRSLECISRKEHEGKVKRPAGRLFCSQGRLLRPTQNCEQRYGGSIIINQVDSLENLEEHKIQEIRPEQVGNSYSGIHTLNFSKEFVTVDVFIRQNGIKCLIAHVRRKLHRMKMQSKGTLPCNLVLHKPSGGI